MAQNEDREVLINLLRPSPLLEKLQRGEFDRRELQDRLDVSRATIHRHTRLLSDLGVIERTSGTFRLTEAGTLLAESLEQFKRDAGTALQLAPVLDEFADVQSHVDVDALAGATVTTAEFGNPYAPVNRFESLLRGTSAFRFVGSEVALIEPCLDVLLELLEDGVDVTFIDRPTCTRYFQSEYPEVSAESLARENFSVFEHEELPPYGFGLFDDRVAVCCFEEQSRTVRALLDTDDRELRAWADAQFASYLETARPVTAEPIVN